MKLKILILVVLVTLTIASNAQNANDTTASEPKSLIVQKAEKMFAKYLPTILESKGEGAFTDIERTFVGDFTNDGVDDVIIWFNYSFGGNSIAGTECAFYETLGNDVKVVAGFEPDYMFVIKEIKNGIVYAEKMQYAEEDGHCCPSVITPIELIYRNNKVSTSQNVVIINNEKDTLNIEKTSIETASLPAFIEGKYYAETCNISLTIYQSKGLYYYNYKSDERNVKGEAIITRDEDTVFIALSGMEFAEDYFDLIQEDDSLEKQKEYEALQKKGKRRTVSCTYSSKGLYMQNYGNAMNYYTQLYDCDEKYIHFIKEYSKEEKQAILTKLMTKKFVDYTLFDWEEGDINNDNIPDFIVVLEAKKPKEADSFARKTVLVETLAFPQLKIAAVNDNLVGCSDCGGGGVGDPYRGIVIKNNYFSVEELYGACCKDTQITTFKYSSKKHNWILHKEGTISSCCIRDEDADILTTTTIRTKKDFGTILFKDY